MKSDKEVVIILFVVVFFGYNVVVENVHVVNGLVVVRVGLGLVVLLVVVVLLLVG